MTVEIQKAGASRIWLSLIALGTRTMVYIAGEWGWREGESQRERERDRQTDRQTETERHIQKDTHIHREKKERETCRET